MITLRIINTDIEYQLTDDNEREVKARLLDWYPETKILVVETGEELERQDIFENEPNRR